MADSLFRRVWRWHFWAGLLACPALLVVAITGGLYTFREEIEDWLYADQRFVSPVGEQKPLSEQLAAVRSAYPDWTPKRVTLSPDPRKSTVVQVDRPAAEQGTAVTLNPYTAAVIADGELRSPFFTGVLKLHRSLFAGTLGRVVVELATSWTLVLLVSGVYLWWPKRWSRIRGVWVPRLRSNPYVVLRDLHTIGGVFLTPIIALIAFTGLFFTIVWLWSFNAVTDGAGKFPRHLISAPVLKSTGEYLSPLDDSVVDVAIAKAKEQYPEYRLQVSLPMDTSTPITVTARPGSVTTEIHFLVVEAASGEIVAVNHSQDLPLWERARLAVLPIHMGTIGGLTTKIIALFACLVLAGLAVSGLAMWLVRRPNGKFGFPRNSRAEIPEPAVVLILLLAAALPTVGISLIVVLSGEWIWGLIDRRLDITRTAIEASCVELPSTEEALVHHEI